MSHIRETSKVTINTSYFHPAHQHYTDEAQKAEMVPSVYIYNIYITSNEIRSTTEQPIRRSQRIQERSNTAKL